MLQEAKEGIRIDVNDETNQTVNKMRNEPEQDGSSSSQRTTQELTFT